MRKFVKNAQKSILGAVAVLTIVWSSGAAFIAPRIAQAAPFSWPASWNVATVGGVPITDFEERSGCTDPTNGGSAVSPDEADIGSEADCQGGTRVNPGSAPSQYYFYDEGAIPTINCATTADDYFYMRTRYAGNPLENGGAGLKGTIWNQILDTTGDGVADFIIGVNGADESMRLYSATTPPVQIGATISTNVLAQGYVRVVTTPEQPPVDDDAHAEYFMDMQIPISAFPAGAICAGTSIVFTQVATAQDPNFPVAKDTLFTVPGDPIPVGDGVDLAVTKTVDDATPAEGATVVYTVTVVNNGPDDATGVTVDDLLPTGVTYVSDDSSGAYNAATGVWTVGDLADDASATINITVTVDQDTAGDTITNTACTDYEEDEEPANDCDSVDIIPVDDVEPTIDLEVTKDVDNGTPNEGDTIVYTISVLNDSNTNATNVSVSDLLPTGVTYVSDDGAGAYVSATGVWTIGSLAAGATAALNITATVDSGTATQTITNTACASADETDSDPSDDCDDADVVVDTISAINADLEVSKIASDSTPQVGTNFTYTVGVTNAGPDNATNVVVNDLLPVGVTWVSDDSAGAYNPVTGVWTIGALANGATATLVITVSVDPGTAGTLITNTACADADETDPDSTDDCDSADITPDPINPVEPTADDLDIAVTESVDDATPNEGQTVAFTITALNVGPIAATGLQLRVVLPAGVTFVSSAGVGSYDPATQIWTIGNLGVGNSAVLTLSATVNAGTGGQTLTSTATLAAVDQTDTDATNNDDDATITIPTITPTQTPTYTPPTGSLVETGFGSSVQMIAGFALLAALATFLISARRNSTAKAKA